MQILELNENGEYMPVEVVPAQDVRTGGIFQLKQVRHFMFLHGYSKLHHCMSVSPQLLFIMIRIKHSTLWPVFSHRFNTDGNEVFFSIAVFI